MRSNPFLVRVALCGLSVLMVVLVVMACGAGSLSGSVGRIAASSTGAGVVNQAFAKAAGEFQVPESLLKAICYMEGRLSDNGGRPSIDNGYGCMHLIQNSHGDLLDRAARELGISANQLKTDLPSTIRGGAVLLRDDALQLSPTHRLPNSLSDWYGALAVYSHATLRSTALMYAKAVYTILEQGFSAEADDGETIILLPQRVQPNVVSAAAVKSTGNFPSGCKIDQNVDYPQAVDCLVPGKTFDCNKTPPKAPCTFESAQRPDDYAIDQIVIHDIEGTAQASLDVFQNAKTQASVHYIVDSDGTIYQVVREKDIAYHAGNYWYNQHSIGIEHAGVDANGYRWYNASEYLASAKLLAYLLKKYHLPLDHEQIVSHGTIPSPSATNLPNHVDPGPYWLWDYYLKLVHKQGVPYPAEATSSHIFLLHPRSDQRPLGSHGQETSANFSFFYLYNGPSTASGRIPQLGNGHDITDVSGCVEPDVSYYYLSKVVDPAGSGDTMYKIWYGVVDHPTNNKRFAHARLAWLAVPRGAAGRGEGTPVVLQANGGPLPLIYGQPTTGKKYIIGDAPVGSVFASTYTVIEDDSNTGDQNNTGNTGNTTGNQNNTGNTGTPPTGSQNSTGSIGTPTTGSQSSTGSVGTPPTGSQNSTGSIGTPTTGSQNAIGNIGTPTPGTQGITGTPTPGTQNTTGNAGYPGTNSPGQNTGSTGGTGNLWYEINYNHRQGWVPASEATLLTGNGH